METVLRRAKQLMAASLYLAGITAFVCPARCTVHSVPPMCEMKLVDGDWELDDGDQMAVECCKQSWRHLVRVISALV